MQVGAGEVKNYLTSLPNGPLNMDPSVLIDNQKLTFLSSVWTLDAS